MFDLEGKEYDEVYELDLGATAHFKLVTDEEVVEQRRWVTVWKKVVQSKETGNFYSVLWEAASTESCEGSESDDVYICQVYPHTITTTVYRADKQDGTEVQDD